MAGSPRPLSTPDIAARLSAQFGDAIAGSEEVHGHAVITVSRERFQEVATFVRDEPELDFDFFDFLSGVDYREKGGGFEVVAHLYSTRNRHNLRLKVRCDAEEPHCPTVSGIWPGANWSERETWELLGIVFDGHPHLVKLVLPEQFEGHPLRRDFALMTREAKPWPGAAEGEEIEE